ncbi:hypothetical protein [Rhodococcus ruber]|uniref:hypothetical protein n=1 Tax=Rhodococcus ruber TaxID=1830 RepID=UPI0013182DE4|nr:hypothetical protein [Rhodococcus ruber]QGS70797.1 hypothetical protein E2561_25375 [Rhodococcus ruber]
MRRAHAVKGYPCSHPVDRPVAVEVLDCLADMGVALGTVDAALDTAARHARLLP